MINSNDAIHEGRGNGTLCQGMKIKLKNSNSITVKDWDGYKVNTVSIDDVEYILCQHLKENENDRPRYFRLIPENNTVTVTLKIFGQKIQIGGINATQFGVNSNIATTGHKLQGMTKTNLIVVSWFYGCKNWVYVVLSRVRTLCGLFLITKLDPKKEFTVEENLLKEEQRLKGLEQKIIKQRVM